MATLELQQTLSNGISEIQEGHFADGEALLRRVLAQSPDDPAGWLWLGWSAFWQNERRTAQRCFLQAQRHGHADAAQGLRALEASVLPAAAAIRPIAEPRSQTGAAAERPRVWFCPRCGARNDSTEQCVECDGLQAGASAASHPPTPQAASHPPTPQAASRPPAPQAASRPPAAQAVSRPAAPQVASRPTAPQAASRPPATQAGSRPPVTQAASRPPAPHAGRPPRPEPGPVVIRVAAPAPARVIPQPQASGLPVAKARAAGPVQTSATRSRSPSVGYRLLVGIVTILSACATASVALIQFATGDVISMAIGAWNALTALQILILALQIMGGATGVYKSVMSSCKGSLRWLGIQAGLFGFLAQGSGGAAAFVFVILAVWAGFDLLLMFLLHARKDEFDSVEGAAEAVPAATAPPPADTRLPHEAAVEEEPSSPALDRAVPAEPADAAEPADVKAAPASARVRGSTLSRLGLIIGYASFFTPWVFVMRGCNASSNMSPFDLIQVFSGPQSWVLFCGPAILALGILFFVRAKSQANRQELGRIKMVLNGLALIPSLDVILTVATTGLGGIQLLFGVWANLAGFGLAYLGAVLEVRENSRAGNAAEESPIHPRARTFHRLTAVWTGVVSLLIVGGLTIGSNALTSFLNYNQSQWNLIGFCVVGLLIGNVALSYKLKAPADAAGHAENPMPSDDGVPSRPGASDPTQWNVRTVLSGRLAPLRDRVAAGMDAAAGQPAADSLLTKGILEIKRGNVSRGMDLLWLAIRESPQDALTWMWLGYGATRSKDQRTAERCFTQAKLLGHPQAERALKMVAK